MIIFLEDHSHKITLKQCEFIMKCFALEKIPFSVDYNAIIFVLDLKPHRKEEGNSDTYSFLNKLFKVQMHFSLKALFLTLSMHLSLLFVILLQIENKNHKQNNK